MPSASWNVTPIERAEHRIFALNICGQDLPLDELVAIFGEPITPSGLWTHLDYPSLSDDIKEK